MNNQDAGKWLLLSRIVHYNNAPRMVQIRYKNRQQGYSAIDSASRYEVWFSDDLEKTRAYAKSLLTKPERGMHHEPMPIDIYDVATLKVVESLNP